MGVSNTITLTGLAPLTPTYIHNFLINGQTSPPPVTAGQNVTFSGYLSTNPSGPSTTDTIVNGEIVNLEYEQSPGIWVVLAQVYTQQSYMGSGWFNGSFIFNLGEGTWNLHAYYAGNGGKNLEGCDDGIIHVGTLAEFPWALVAGASIVGVGGLYYLLTRK